MARAYFPFYLVPTAAVEKALGADVPRVAQAALKAILRHGKGLEIAHQQICYQGHELAFSSCVTAAGDLVLDIDLGDPKLRARIVLEKDLRAEGRTLRGVRSPRRH